MTENDLLDELTRMINLPTVGPDDVTAKRLEVEAKCSNATARRLLMLQVQDGKLREVQKRDHNGRPVMVYERV